MPITSTTMMKLITRLASLRSRACCIRTPMDSAPGTITSSSPAIRLRQENAQPCLRPEMNDGSDAGRIR
jgi:hypothetical protein